MTDLPAPPPAAPPAPPARFETRQEGVFHGTRVAYRCLAGETHLPNAKDVPWVSLFSFSYLADSDSPHTRPVLFSFNGGPGSASLWLHMGAMGPRRIDTPSDATPARPPVPVVDNALCCLDIADLVFIDPPGTGYSRMLGDAKAEEAWGLEQDAEIVASFIKTWLSTHRRWASPRYLCGESYGTTRAVAVAGKLAAGLSGVAFDGIALVSMVLDFHTVRFERGNPLADAAYLPSYAATALHHGRVAPEHGRADFLDFAREFAVHDYLPALVAGSRLAPERFEEVLEELSGFTGLHPDWLRRTRLRIDPARFRKELLRDQGLTVGRFDSRYTGTDHDGVGEVPDADASSYAIDSAYVSAANDHLTRVLGIDLPRAYVPFNREALTRWDWSGARPDQPRWPACVNVAPTLARLLREQPGLRVLVANGLFDLATPFGAAEATIAGNGIEPGRVRMTYYEAGHMMYLHRPSLDALIADLRRLMDGGS